MKKKVYILILEDRPEDAELMVHELRKAELDFEWSRIDNEPSYLAALNPGVDIILADYKMPQFEAPQALSLLQERDLDIPFIVVSGSVGEDIAVAMMRNGAYDYLLKDRLARLNQTILRAIQERNVRIAKRRAEERLLLQGAALHAAANAVMITDRDGLIEWVNPAFEKMTGYSFEEAFGKNPRLLKSGQHSLDFYRELWATIAEGKVWRSEIINKHRSGTLYTEEITITAVKDKAENITHFVAVMQDVTDKQLLQQQLVQAQKMESIATLAGGVAHDFNNLLLAISGFTDMALSDMPETDRHREDIAQVKLAAERATKLTRQLLSFARKETTEAVELDINSVIENVKTMLGRLLGDDIVIHSVLAPDLHHVKADPSQIDQIIMNLAVNARDAMPSGGQLILSTANVTLTAEELSAHPNARSGSFIRLSVADTGTGMTAEVVQRIFDPFFTTKEAGKGTGLGLSVVYGITRKHEGWVEVESAPGKGSVFKVYLPVFSQSSPPAYNARNDVLDDVLKGAGERILLVEDDDGVREFVARTLRGSGYHVFSAANGREANKLFRQEGTRIDLLLTDMVLPGKNAVTLVEEFLSSRPDLGVVLTSGYADAPAKWPEAKARGWRLLQKPFPAAALLTTVREALNNRK